MATFKHHKHTKQDCQSNDFSTYLMICFKMFVLQAGPHFHGDCVTNIEARSLKGGG